MAEKPITVLFVDDDEQWATYIADELEAEDPTFAVRVAGNVNEAVIALDDSQPVDCVVTDFRMPEVDGIQLLERVNESHPNLPCILVTGDGNEDVAARAINAGVTDYIRKDPLVDQAPLFVTRIRQAVDRARLERRVRESEQRYRTVIEHTRDAIVILRDEQIVFSNDRFEELCGSSADADSPPTTAPRIHSSRSLFDYVHEDDHEQVTDLVRSTRSTDDSGLDEVRLVTPTGTVRHCELLGDAITYENDPATLLSIRNVTRRRSRERTLTRERKFNQAVQKRLMGVHTRDELESEITTVLHSFSYDLVWIGTVDERGVRTRATAGDDEFVTRLTDDASGDDHGGDPILWSARTGDPQFVPDFEALMATNRRNDALECGLRTGYALPLRHEDVSYGVLAVYHAEPDWIDDAERSLLTEVAETVSFAIHHVETRQTLTSAERVVVEVDLESADYYLTRLLSERFDHTGLEVTVSGTQVSDGDADVQYLSCSSDEPAEFADALESHSSVRSLSVVDRGEQTVYRVIVGGDTPEAHLGSIGASVRSTTAVPGRATIVFELSSREYLQPAVDRLKDHYGSVAVRSVREETGRDSQERYARIGIDSLTDKQLIALEAAFHHGYFERPRRYSASEIAESLGITHTTYLQHLRVAQRKVFRQLFGGGDGSPSSDNR